MKKLFIKILLLVSFIVPTTFALCQSDTNSLIDKLHDYMEQKQIPGAMISIVRGDSVLFAGGIGFANIENQERVSVQHLFRQGSISKSFTALALYKLLEDSPHSLDSPLKEIDPTLPFDNTWEKDAPVRVSHLLEHTSGFEDFHLHAIYNTKDATVPPMINMVNDHRQSLHSRWKPGSKKAYSNPNYIVAGHLIEVLSKESYSEHIQENILAPIGMKHSGFYFKAPKNSPFAQGYQRTGTTLNPLPFATINGGPAGDFCANAADMATYLQFMLNRDSLLFAPNEFDRIESPQTSIAAKKGLQAGYGLGNYTIWKNGHLFHGHGGQIDGFTSRYVYSRAADLGIAISINRNGNANDLVDEILDYLLGKEIPAPANRITQPIPESLKEQFAGFYEFKSPKSNLLAFSDRMLAGLQLDFQKDKIITRTILGKAKDTLFYAGNNQFYVNNEGLASTMLIESDGGKSAFWVNENYTEKESRTKRLILFFGLLISLLLLASFLLYSIVWFLRRFFKKEKLPTTNHLVLFGAILSLILMFLGFGLTMDNAKDASTMSFYSLLFYLSSYAMLILSFLSVWRWFKLPKKNGFRVYYILTSVAAVALSIYLWNIGWIGLQLWNY